MKDFFQYESDRILVFMFTGYNEMRDYNQKYLICEVMGRYSNLILTTDTYSIIDVLKKMASANTTGPCCQMPSIAFRKQTKKSVGTILAIPATRYRFFSQRPDCLL